MKTFTLLLSVVLSSISSAWAAPVEAAKPLYPEKQAEFLLQMSRRALVPGTVFDRRAFVRTVQGNGSISGRVYGPAPDELGSAWVEAFTADNNPEAGDFAKGLSMVDRDGSYRIADLPPGRYIVMAYADGYELTYYNNVRDIIQATHVVVEADRETEGIDFTLKKLEPGTASISGMVYDRESGAPLPFAMVNAFSPLNGEYCWTTADTLGSYSLTDMRPGTYIVVAWAEGYLAQYYNHKSNFLDADAVALGDSVALENIDFHLQLGGSISGMVTDSSGNPVEGAYLLAAPMDEFDPDRDYDPTFGKAISDENGEYTITGLASGDYIVQLDAGFDWSWVTLWYRQKQKREEADPVPVVVGRKTTGIDFVLPFSMPKAVLSGRVTDSSGAPITGAYISAQPVSPDVWAYGWAVTDEEGRYAMERLPEGSYYVSAGVQNGWQYVHRWWPDAELFENAVPVFVSEAQPATADFVLPLVIGKSSIRGRVVDSEGRPLPWANISISPAGRDPQGTVINSVWAWAYTDSAGEYSVKNLPAGDYLAFCNIWQEQNYGEQWWNNKSAQEEADVIHLGEEEALEGVDFRLTVKPIYGAIVGSVVDSLTGRPIQRAFVQVTAVEAGGAPNRCFYWRRPSAITDEEGRFAVDWLFEGEYVVSVYAEGAFEFFENAPVMSLARKIQVKGGQKSEIEFKLTPRRDGRGAISGRVLMQGSGIPFDIAVVTARPQVTTMQWPQSELFYTAVTDSEGFFTLRGLPENVPLILYAFSSWGVGEYYDDVYDPEEATPVTAGVPEPVVIKDIELAVYRWLWYDGGNNREKGNTDAQIVGRVTDGDGVPIAEAHVIAFDESRQPVADAFTDREGYYSIGGLMPGRYVLQAGRSGYRSAYNNNAVSLGSAPPIVLGNGVVQVDFVLDLKTGVGHEKPKLPNRLRLAGNFPNPFNPETRIVFELPESEQVYLAVYNSAGKKTATVFSGRAAAGRHEIKWNGCNDAGEPASCGVYFYKLVVGGEQIVGKMVLLR